MSLQGIAASWGNVGYMGVPLCLAASGEQGLPPAMLAVIVAPSSPWCLAALPTAANAFVLAKQFDLSVEQNTAAVLLSTAFSVIALSALLVWLRVS